MGLSTHVLDTARGRPADGVAVVLERHDGDRWATLTDAVTNDDGRVGDLLGGGDLQTGMHRLTFATGEYHRAVGVDGFHPEVSIVFEVTDVDEHYHVPLLLSPYGYTTYRGS